MFKIKDFMLYNSKRDGKIGEDKNVLRLDLAGNQISSN